MPWPRIPTKYNLHRTDSGRISSGADTADPEKSGGLSRKPVQVQNWPRALRDSVVADEGKVIIGADWSAIEWCVVMYLAGLTVGDGYHHGLLDKFQRGEFDPHRFLASLAFECSEPDVTSEQRRTAKVFTFGCLFKGKPENLGAKHRINKLISQKVGKAHEQAFRLRDWQLETIERAVKQRYVDTVGGWRRWFFELPSRNSKGEIMKPDPGEILAHRVQGTAADILKYVMTKALNDPQVIRVWGENDPEAWIEVLTNLHDALYIIVPEEREAEGREWLSGYMSLPIPFLNKRSWRCELKSGRDWRSVS